MTRSSDKLAESATQILSSVESQIDYRLLVENQSDMFVQVDAEGRFLYVNPSYCRTFGKTAQELLGTSIMPLVHEDDRELSAKAIEALWQPPHITHVEQRTLTAAGWRWLSWQSTAVLDQNGRVKSIIGVGQDITSLRQTENALRESEIKYRSFVENSFDVIFTLDATGIFRYVCPSWGHHFGYPAEEVIGKPFAPVVHPDDIQACFSYLQRVLDSGEPGTSPRYRVICSNGSWKTFIANGSRFIDAKGDMLFHGVGRDISELDRILIQIQASDEKFTKAFNLSPALMSISTIEEGRYIDVNDCFCKISGLERQDVIGRTSVELGWIPAAKRQKMREILQRDGQINDVELELIRPDGAVITVLYTAVIITIAGQNRLLSIAPDISERKKALDTLFYVDECFNQALNGANHILYRLNVKKGGYDYLSPSAEKIHGIPHADALKYSLEQVFECIHPDDRILISAIIDDAIRTRTSNAIDLELEYRFRKTDGEYCWLLDSSRLIVDDTGEIQCFFGSALDITEQRLQEQALQQSEQIARSILSSTNDMILFIDPDGTILLANEAVAERLGHTMDTFPGTNIFSYLPEDLRQLRQEKLAKAIQTRSPVSYEDVRAGRIFDNCLYPVINSDKKVFGVTVFARDITERKQYEVALKKAKEELETRVDERTASLTAANEQIRQISFQLLKAEEQERIRIAAELHDQVGQSLLLAKMKVDALAGNTATNVNDVKSADISKLLEGCIQDIRTLTFAMRPHLLDTAGIEAALEWLCKSIYENYRVKVDFSTSCRSFQMSSEHRYSLYQAVRELLLNVVKHAGVNYAELSLKTNGNYLMIQVSDNGSGFETTSQSCSSASSIGLGLFNVQQRIELMGGSCRLDSKPGHGTVVTLTIPRGE